MFEERTFELMGRAMELAGRAKGAPVGALVAGPEGEVVSEGCNDRSSPFLHAEAIALRRAQEELGASGFKECTLFCTLEPCAMCAGAALLFKVGRIVFGAWDPEAGACGSVWDIPRQAPGGWKAEVVGGFREKECSKILKDGFSRIR
ncbi:MAG: nucleoside deaminase [Aeriscardovia sp.]|nr:nucleoside deaminase [Aeriscardovia sp.]